MKHIVIEQAPDETTRELHARASPRRVALIGGTTTFDDCLVALRYLAHPRELVDGNAVADF